MNNMKKKLNLIIGFLLILITSCQFNSFNNNSNKDKEDAERVTGQVYALIRLDDYAKTYELFSPKFLQGWDTTQLVDLLRKFDNKLGKVDSIHLDTWNTKVVEGSNPQSDYLLVYTVKRDKFMSKETFGLTKENGVIKIYGYKVESEGFLR